MQFQSKLHKDFLKKWQTDYKIYMEMLMTENSESNLKKEQSWRT